jgi:hypothetical protein
MDFAHQGKNPPTKLAAMANASNLNITQGNSDTWLTNFGASDHITANLNNLNQPIPFKGPEQVSVGNSQNLPIQNIGNTQLHTKLHHFRLRNVYMFQELLVICFWFINITFITTATVILILTSWFRIYL